MFSVSVRKKLITRMNSDPKTTAASKKDIDRSNPFAQGTGTAKALDKSNPLDKGSKPVDKSNPFGGK